MILERRDWLLWAISWVVWRIPGRRPVKMAGFSHTEFGSGIDMLEAAEQTPRADMRAKYFRHALDELKHAGLFRERAGILSQRTGRTQAVLTDSGFIQSHGIRGAESLFSRLDELEFLAFVWVAELRGAQQFDVYADLMRDDPNSVAMFEEIARDERFHVAYSRAELDRYRDQGHQRAVRRAVFRVRRRRLFEAWLRFSRVLGDTMGKLWMFLLYVFVVGPFSLVGRLVERRTSGFLTPSAPEGTPLEQAFQQG